MKRIEGSFRRRAAISVVVACSTLMLAGCQSTSSSTHEEELAPEDDAPFFTSAVFGVKASPRVTRLKRVPKGGGRDQTGKPYVVRGKWYYPKEEPGYAKAGTASWYGSNFHGRLTANGEVYDMYHLSAAHPTFPLPSYARVTNKTTGSSVVVRVNDRGPYMHNRLVDVSSKAAEMLGFQHAGVADVKLEYLGRAPLEGDDTKMLMASYRPGDARAIDDGLPSGVMIASRAPSRAAPASATAFAAPRTIPSLPGVNARPSEISIESLIDGFETAAAETAVSHTALAYASQPSTAGSVFDAVLAADGATNVPRERIEIGTIADPQVLNGIRRLARGAGSLEETATAEGVALALDMPASAAVDDVLRGLWAAGATDAFVLRD